MSTIFLPFYLFCNGGKQMTVTKEIAKLIVPILLELLNSEKSSNKEQKGLDIYKNPSIHCVQEVVNDD